MKTQRLIDDMDEIKVYLAIKKQYPMIQTLERVTEFIERVDAASRKLNTERKSYGNLPDVAEFILSTIERKLGLNRKDVIGKCRKRKLAEARFIAHYLAYEICGSYTLNEIAKALNARDHTQIIYSNSAAKNLMLNANFKAKYDSIAFECEIEFQTPSLIN